MRLALFFLLLTGLAASAPATPVTADDLVPVVQKAFAGCGRSLGYSAALGQAARAELGGQELRAALRAQNYPAFQAEAWEFGFNGNAAWVGQQLARQCSKLTPLSEYGLATDGRKLVLIAARPARVDLTKRERWLEEFLTLTNRARAQARTCGTKNMPAAGPLRWDERLSAAAQGHVNDMIRLNFRGHVNPHTGSQPRQRAQAAGFRGRGVGENLAYGMLTPQEAIKGLLQSPEHCENLMFAPWTLFGAAVGNGTAQTLFPTYWAQLFGMP